VAEPSRLAGGAAGGARRRLTWAVPHTFRRTVATLLDQANLPIARIADQLGHSDVSMTARVYLGRDLKGDKRDLARVL
jgi:integrase